MRRATRSSWMTATSPIGPWHRAQTSTSTAYVRFSRTAQPSRRGRPGSSAATTSSPRGRTGDAGNVLLLDEPTNDLDVDTLRALEEALLGFSGCAVVISHDRWFLDKIATHILAFEGEGQVVWFEGNYQSYEADKKRRLGAAADQPHRLKYKKIAH